MQCTICGGPLEVVKDAPVGGAPMDRKWCLVCREFADDGTPTAEPLMSLKDAFELALRIYRHYMVLGEDDYMKAALWLVGTAYHSSFVSYPYLFLNAMKGSGKSRFLKLTAFLIGGKMTTSLTEAVAFRYTKPLCIDEAETLGRKEKAFLREILNSAYKRGVGVLRARKDEKSGDTRIEEFDPYRPIVIANIDGLDDVLEDRCLTLILEKSYDPTITRRVELFELDAECEKLRKFIENTKSSVGSEGTVGSVAKKTYVGVVLELNKSTPLSELSDTTSTTYIDNTTYTTDTTLKIIEALKTSDVVGRDIELWLPLIVTAASISDDLLSKVMMLAGSSSKDRAVNSMMENRDVALVAYLADFIDGRAQGFVAIADIVGGYLISNVDDKWFTAEWVGRAIRRNGLATSRRRLSRGVEVILDYDRINMKARRYGVSRTLEGFVNQAQMPTVEEALVAKDANYKEFVEKIEEKKENEVES